MTSTGGGAGGIITGAICGAGAPTRDPLSVTGADIGGGGGAGGGGDGGAGGEVAAHALKARTAPAPSRRLVFGVMIVSLSLTSIGPFE